MSAVDPDRPLTEAEREFLRDLAEHCGTVGRHWLPAIALAKTRADGLRLRNGLKQLRQDQREGRAPREYVPGAAPAENQRG